MIGAPATSWFPFVWSGFACVFTSVPICAAASQQRAFDRASPCKLEVHPRIEKKRFAAIHDQGRIAVAPCAVRLEIGIATVAEISESFVSVYLSIRPAFTKQKDDWFSDRLDDRSTELSHQARHIGFRIGIHLPLADLKRCFENELATRVATLHIAIE